MDRHYWYYRFLVDVAWWNNTIADIEAAIKNLILDLTEDTGVAYGMVVSERGAGQNFSVDISSGVAYDTLGKRIFNSGTFNLPFVNDALGSPVQCTGGGNSRVVSIYAYYKMVNTMPTTDGFGATVQTLGTESVEFKLYQGTIATTGTQVPAANPNDGGVLICHVTITTGDSTIATADCNNVPRDRLSPWPRALETDKHLRIWSTGVATWNGASVVLSAAVNIHCMDKTGAAKTGTLPAATYNLSDGQCLVLRLDRSNTGITYTVVTYGVMAAGKYAIALESAVGSTDYYSRDDIILFRRRGTILEIPIKGLYYNNPSFFTIGLGAHEPRVTAASTGNTSNATPTVVGSIPVAEGEVYTVEATISARQSTGANRGSWKLMGSFYRNTAGNVTANGLAAEVYGQVSDTYSVDLVANTVNQTIDIQVTGKAATSVNWSTIMQGLRVV
jgi:hypothetical protein